MASLAPAQSGASTECLFLIESGAAKHACKDSPHPLHSRPCGGRLTVSRMLPQRFNRVCAHPSASEQVGRLTGRVCTPAGPPGVTAARVLGGRPAALAASPHPGPQAAGVRTAAAGLHGGGVARVRAGFSVFGSRVMSSVPQVRQPFVLFVSCPCPPFLPIFQARFGLYAIGFKSSSFSTGEVSPGSFKVLGRKVSLSHFPRLP